MKKFILLLTLFTTISASSSAFACVAADEKHHDPETLKKCIYACMITYDDPSNCELGSSPQQPGL